VALTELPVNLRPSLAAAAADSPRVYADGCHAKPATVRPASRCAYGDLASNRTMVLFGDSHAAQWFPALMRIALDRHWRLVSLTKSGCTAADATIWSDLLQRAYTECDAWRRAAITRIGALRPALVVVSSTYVYRLTDSHATWRAAWARTFAALSPAPVAVLSDTPTMNVQVPECLSQHPVPACNRDVTATVRQPQRRILAAFGGKVTVIDPVPWLCSTVCPTVLGNLLVYRDSTHLTTAMADALAPLLAARLPRAG
jgi:SGNH domain (fused to AT3 domains)